MVVEAVTFLLVVDGDQVPRTLLEGGVVAGESGDAWRQFVQTLVPQILLDHFLDDGGEGFF